MDNNQFRIVKKWIDTMDYYDLLASGAPKDEFDSESREISRRINPQMSAQQIADIIAEVFNVNFGEDTSIDYFLPIAEAIQSNLMK